MPNLQEGLVLSGRVRVQAHDAQGNLVWDGGWLPNKLTNYMANVLAQWLTGVNNTGYNPVLPPLYVEAGTGSGTPAPTDTNLFTPVSATYGRTSIQDTPSNGVAEFVSQYYGDANNSGDYTEVGLFDANGNMFAHTMYSFSIASGQTTTITWDITMSPS